MAKGVTRVGDIFGNDIGLQDNGLAHENRPEGYGITADDRQRILERHNEVMQERQAASGSTLALALALAQALRQQQGQG